MRLVDSTSNLVTQCAGHVVLVKNPRTLILKWLIDRVLRRINNISAMQRRRLLVECDQFWKFPCRPTLCRNQVKLSFACQGGCYTWQGAPFNVPSNGHISFSKYILMTSHLITMTSFCCTKRLFVYMKMKENIPREMMNSV